MSKELKYRFFSSLFLIPVSFILIVEGNLLFNSFLILFFFISSFEWYKMSKKINFKLIGYIFLLTSFLFAYKLRNFPNKDLGVYVFFYVLIICISTDIGGYVFGKLFKGPKLIKFSPNKTYAGMFGGFILSIISIFFFLELLKSSFDINFNYFSNITLVTLLISLVSQIGDIIVSYHKRLINIKNTGNIIPGHGGILDRIDGMLFAFPFSFLIFSFNIL